MWAMIILIYEVSIQSQSQSQSLNPNYLQQRTQNMWNKLKFLFLKQMYCIIFLIRETFIFLFQALDNLIKYNTLLFKWIEKLNINILFILWKIITNILFFKLFYITSKVMCLINLLIFVFKLDFIKATYYLKKLWIIAIIFLFGYYPIISLIITFICIFFYVYNFIDNFLSYKEFETNKHVLLYKILCVWDEKIVQQIKHLQTEMRKVYIKDLNKLLEYYK